MKSLRKEINSKIDVKKILNENRIKYFNGGDSYKICCLFHKEDTPSCFISSKKKVFHCFGCNISGDLVFLLSKIKKISIEQILATYSLSLNVLPTNLNHYEYLEDKTKLDELRELEDDYSYILNQKYELLKLYIKKLENELVFSDMFVKYYKLVNEIELLENDLRLLRVDIFDEKRK